MNAFLAVAKLIVFH